jgi:hypothetical protein
MALALPEMVVGENTFTYSDQSGGNRKVRITHNWVERSASKPPPAPAGPVFPRDGGEANGTNIVFQWVTPEDPDGDRIADYQFELSARADMKWPLSMSFYKLISRTADAAKEKDQTSGKERITVRARYTVPQPGLLTPDDCSGTCGPRTTRACGGLGAKLGVSLLAAPRTRWM